MYSRGFVPALPANLVETLSVTPLFGRKFALDEVYFLFQTKIIRIKRPQPSRCLSSCEHASQASGLQRRLSLATAQDARVRRKSPAARLVRCARHLGLDRAGFGVDGSAWACAEGASIPLELTEFVAQGLFELCHESLLR